MATKQGKTYDADLAEDLVAGTQKHYPKASQQLTFGGVTQTVGQVTTNLNKIVTLRTNTTNAQAAAKAAVVTEKTQRPALIVFMDEYITFLKATFGNSPDGLKDFGLAPKKTKAPMTVEQKAAAAAKRKSTREARGTKGTKQKKQVKGNVTGVVVTPITSPEPVSPAPAPAAAPAAVTNGNGSATHT